MYYIRGAILQASPEAQSHLPFSEQGEGLGEKIIRCPLPGCEICYEGGQCEAAEEKYKLVTDGTWFSLLTLLGLHLC